MVCTNCPGQTVSAKTPSARGQCLQHGAARKTPSDLRASKNRRSRLFGSVYCLEVQRQKKLPDEGNTMMVLPSPGGFAALAVLRLNAEARADGYLLSRMMPRRVIKLLFLSPQHKDASTGHSQGDYRNDEFIERHAFTSLRILPRI